MRQLKITKSITNRESQSLEKYLQEIGKVDLLTPEEEVELAKRILGLIKAAQRFDETRGFKFISYAVWWIRQSILQALAEQSRIVRLPLNKVGSLNKINKAFSELEQYKQSLKAEIARSLNTLTPRQCDVIKYYFGIGMKHSMSLEDIGDKFGLTRERVRQIKDKAINKLRNPSRSKQLKNYLG